MPQFEKGNTAAAGNSTRWKPGQSGTPGGMPQGTVKLGVRFQTLLECETQEEAEAYLDSLPFHVARIFRAELADLENITTRKHIWDRRDGPVKQEIEIDDLRKLSDAELIARAAGIVSGDGSSGPDAQSTS